MTQIAQLMTAPICPRCGREAQATETRYGIRHDCCDTHSWGGKPLETQATHNARKRAHAAFDPLWRDGPLSRGHAYRLLSETLDVDAEDCHISLMSEEDALRVPPAVEEIRKTYVEEA